MRMSWTKLLANVAIISVSTLVTIIIVNIAFNIMMPKIISQKYFPRSLINELGVHYQTFYPSVNDGKLKNWIAVLGDSYGVGSGDAYLENEELYGIFHYQHQATKNNFYIFARDGYGNINSVKEYFLTKKEIESALFYPDWETPKRILFLFYEGNDLDNNLSHYKRFNTNKDIKDFVRSDIEQESKFKRKLEFYFPLLDIIKPRTIKKVFNFGSNDYRDRNSNNTIVMKNGSLVEYPTNPQAASPEQDDEELDISLNILFESLRYLKENTNNIPIEIIYLPSVVTTYAWKNPVYVQTIKAENNKFISCEDNTKRSILIRKKIKDFAKQIDIEFIDTTDDVIEAGAMSYLHGKKDPEHFNTIGYKLVSNLLDMKLLGSNVNSQISAETQFKQAKISARSAHPLRRKQATR